VAGTTRWERRTSQKRQATAHIDQRIRHWSEKYLGSEEHFGRCRPLASVITRLTGERVTIGNGVQLLPDTGRSMEHIEKMIEQARRYVHLEFYIWRSDKVGDRIRDLLVRKAREGVDVRLLYDGFGSLWLGRKFLRALRDGRVETACFTPGLSLWHLLTLNLRNHRKIVISDGLVGLTGGMNIGQEYLMPTEYFGQWRDTQILVRGPAVLQLQQVFAQDWYFATGEALTADEFFPQPDVQAGNIAVQVVADGPDDDVDAVYALMMAAIGQADRSVTLATPYFVPPEGLAVTLETAALRGVRVRIMTAGRGNWTWTHQAGRSYYNALLKAGVEIWEYQRGLYHAKTLTVDGQWSLVGTPNCDFRSFILNFEVALAMYDDATAAELERQFENDLQFARRIELDEWQKRSTIARLHEQFWRLFAPVL
jgi:cardiolipin synthase